MVEQNEHTCRECNGTGCITFMSFTGGEMGQECPLCKGTGMVRPKQEDEEFNEEFDDDTGAD